MLDKDKIGEISKDFGKAENPSPSPALAGSFPQHVLWLPRLKLEVPLLRVCPVATCLAMPSPPPPQRVWIAGVFSGVSFTMRSFAFWKTKMGNVAMTEPWEAGIPRQPRHRRRECLCVYLVVRFFFTYRYAFFQSRQFRAEVCMAWFSNNLYLFQKSTNDVTKKDLQSLCRRLYG